MSIFSVKEYRANKHNILKIASELPPVFRAKQLNSVVPGFQLINSGVEYLKANEPVSPVKDYLIREVKYEPINHVEEMRKIFMDKGIGGLKHYVGIVVKHAETQRKQLPHLFTSPNSQS